MDSEIAGRKHFHHYTHLASKHQGTVQGVQFVIFVTTCLFCVQIVLTRGNEKNSHDLSLALIQMSFSSISMKQVLEPSFSLVAGERSLKTPDISLQYVEIVHPKYVQLI